MAKNIVIVGGGISGVATSYFLARRGIPSTLVDPVGIAPAASGKAGGFLALDWNDGSSVGPLARKSFGLHAELAKEFGEATVDYRRLTCKAVACGGHGGGTLRQKKVAGVEWADLGVIGSQPMGDETSIAQVHPKKLCDSLWAASERLAGSTLTLGQAEAVETDTDTGSVCGVRLSGGRALDADAVLLAMGPWSPSWLGLPTALGVKYHSLIMRPGRTHSQAVFVQGLGDPEVYPRPDGTAYVTGFPDPAAVVREKPGEVDVRSDACERLQAAVQQVSTEFAAAPVEVAQACHLPVVGDGSPLLGSVPGTPGAYVATGGGCWGILCGPAIGLGMAELIVDGMASSVDLQPFSPARFMR